MKPLERLQKKLSNLGLQRTGFAVCVVGETGSGKTHTLGLLRQALPQPSLTVAANLSTQTLLTQLPRPERPQAWLEKNLERHDTSLQTVLGLLASLAPMVLFVEDLHHQANPLWQELKAAVAQCPKVALVFSSRESMTGCENIHLEPLGLSASRELLERELGSTLPQVAVAWIFQRASGNPFFLLEYLRYLARIGFLWNDGTRWHWREPPDNSMPIQIEALLEEQLFGAQLSPEQERVLLATAYLEMRLVEFTPTVLAQVAETSPQALRLQCSTLLQLGLLGQQQKIAHPLLRELLFGKGQAHHTGFAKHALNALEDAPEQAALVLPDTRLEPAEQANQWLVLAQKTHDQPLLSAQFRLKAAEHSTGNAKTDLLRQALSGLYLSQPSTAIEVARSLLALPELEAEVLATTVYTLCHALCTTSRNLEAVKTELQRLDESETKSARYFYQLFGYTMLCGQAVAALELWVQHPEFQAGAEIGTQIHLLSAQLLTGQFEQVLSDSQALLERELDVRQRMGVLNVRAVALAQTGQLELSEQHQLLAIQVAKETGQHNAIGTLLFNRALTLDRRGDVTMRQCAEEAIAALTRAGNLAQATQAHLLVSNHDLERGRYAEAFERLDHAYASLKYTPPSPFLVTLLLTMAHQHRERRLPYSRSLAQTFAREGFKVAQKIGQPRLVAAAQAQLVLSATTPDLEMAQAALEGLKNHPEPGSIFAYAAWAVALEWHQPHAATQAWIQAASRAEALGFDFDAQLYRLEVARRETDHNAAKTLHDWFTERGLLHGAHVAVEYFPDLTTAPAATPSLELVVLNGFLLAEKVVKGSKRQELLLHLLEARVLGKKEVSSLDLLDRLYPSQAEQEAQIALRQLVFKTRAAHGTTCVLTTQNGYALGAVSSDLERFLHAPNLSTWRTVYPSFGSPDVREVLHQTTLRHAQNCLQTAPNDVAQAMRLLLESDPYEVAAIALGCLALENNPKALSRFYKAQKEKFLEIGETLPEDWQKITAR
jgi:hypothetical protein